MPVSARRGAFSPRRRSIPTVVSSCSPGEQARSDAAIEAFVRQRCETLYHPVGTCKMDIDAMAMVAPDLRVRGLGGLRVVDASILPTLIGGNTNTPTTIIAEKAADMIRRTR